MSLSLRDQLIQMGLATEKQGKQVEQRQRQQPKPSRHQPPKPSEQQLAAQRAQSAKVARDLELNRKQQEKAERKARQAEVRQIIEQNRLPKPEGEDYFNFTSGKAIKRIAVNAQLREQITRGEIQIVSCDGRYDLVPKSIAERIAERVPQAVVQLGGAPTPAADDPYSEHAIPDDLMW